MEYKHCFMAHRQQPTQQTLTNYIDSHNAYVQQIHTTNSMLEFHNIETIPQLMQELEDIYSDLCGIVSEAIFNGADVISAKVLIKFVDIYSVYVFVCVCGFFFLACNVSLIFKRID